MDLTQSKLSKTEWLSIERPVAERELPVLRLIVQGYADVNARVNTNSALLSILKITIAPGMEHYLYVRFFAPRIATAVASVSRKMTELPEWLDVQTTMASALIAPGKHKLKKIDQMRLGNIKEDSLRRSDTAFEMTMLDVCEKLLAALRRDTCEYAIHLYTLNSLLDSTVAGANMLLVSVVRAIATFARATKPNAIADIVADAYAIFERNPLLLKYADLTLYAHQKRLFRILAAPQSQSNLILYTAPTGTGKTLSPIGLACGHRIIFVCAARHIGLSLAKSAIAVEQRVAFAFGCETAADIRLHYFSAIDYTRNRRSGGIGKVDNSNGAKVDIMICDVKSYLVAMLYMLAFNDAQNIILYWDEPTITMDCGDHELHATIASNWRNNQIPTVVLSCATLPRPDEIADTLSDFRARFADAEIHVIESHDCKKTITILDEAMHCVLPHLLFAEFSELQDCIANCIANKSLLRYLDLNEVVRFIHYINNLPDSAPELKVNEYFSDLRDITMDSLKLYYLEILRRVNAEQWLEIHTQMLAMQSPKFGVRAEVSNDTTISRPVGGVLITTADAHTLTDGPAIFLADDVDKVANFCVQQARVSGCTIPNIMEKITANASLRADADVLARNIQDKIGNDAKKSNKMDKEQFSPEVQKMMNAAEMLQSKIVSVKLDSVNIPNTVAHQRVWSPTGNPVRNAFVSSVDDATVQRIMETSVGGDYKLLLMMGIGAFGITDDAQYADIVKDLAANQKLLMVIAGTDYIYGTNYPFCHGYIGKDLHRMTQQKIIQALGRIGRGNMQQDYTVRIRSREILVRLFACAKTNPEAEIMQRLFCAEM